jgi:hypothetical protein
MIGARVAPSRPQFVRPARLREERLLRGARRLVGLFLKKSIWWLPKPSNTGRAKLIVFASPPHRPVGCRLVARARRLLVLSASLRNFRPRHLLACGLDLVSLALSLRQALVMDHLDKGVGNVDPGRVGDQFVRNFAALDDVRKRCGDDEVGMIFPVSGLGDQRGDLQAV